MLSLTATELNRFMNCEGSRKLGKVEPVNIDTTSTDQGNAAHWLVEQVFKGDFSIEELADRKAPNGVFITADMIEHVQEYLADIAGKGQVEIDTSHSDGANYEVRGRSDYVNFDGSNLFVSDFKYGWKIVEPENNWTLISHALGWYFRNQDTVPSSIIFTIYQPRPYHPEGSVRRWEISFDELMHRWQEMYAKLTNPSDDLNTGEHCYKCPSMSQCPASQIASMNSIDVSEMVYNSEVDNRQLSFIMDEIKRAKTILSQVEDAYNDLALIRVRKGENVPGYSMQATKGNLSWKKGLSCETVQLMTGIDVSKKNMITPTQAKKIGISQEIIDSLCERENKGFKLVRVDGSKKAEQLFGKR